VQLLRSIPDRENQKAVIHDRTFWKSFWNWSQ